MPDNVFDKYRDQMTDGRRFRILTVVDDCTRECLALIADTSLSGARVARELGILFEARGKPVTIVSDNVLGREELADLGTRSQDSRMHDCLHRIAQAGSAVKKWSLP